MRIITSSIAVGLVVLKLVTFVEHQSLFLQTVIPLLRTYGLSQSSRQEECKESFGSALMDLNREQRYAVGAAFVSANCKSQATVVLPVLEGGHTRYGLLAYQWGKLAWLHDDVEGAVAAWRQGKDIDRLLLSTARQLRGLDPAEAMRWYEASIMTAQSSAALAESLVAYTEEMRGLVAPDVFRTQLLYLEMYFGESSAIVCRLSGQRLLAGGAYAAAHDQLRKAIDLGIDDAETWYLLGEAAWKLNDVADAERAYRSALNASTQVLGRRPWYLSRLATLLNGRGRSSEALSLMEEAVHLSDYYLYSDNLALLYAQRGENSNAQLLCARARILAGTDRQPLRCEMQ